MGCGTGDVTRWLAEKGARAVGIDMPEMLKKARKQTKIRDEIYLEGKAESLPIQSDKVDIILYIASLHHVPVARMPEVSVMAILVARWPDGVASTHGELSNTPPTCVKLLLPTGRTENFHF